MWSRRITGEEQVAAEPHVDAAASRDDSDTEHLAAPSSRPKVAPWSMKFWRMKRRSSSRFPTTSARCAKLLAMRS